MKENNRTYVQIHYFETKSLLKPNKIEDAFDQSKMLHLSHLGVEL